MKVLCISTSSLKNNGITNILLDYYGNMNQEKLTIHILNTRGITQEIEEKIHNLNLVIKKTSLRKNIISYVIKTAKLIKTEKYDIVHVNGSSSLLAIDLFTALLGGCKTRIAHSHNTACNHYILNKLLKPLFKCMYTDALACGQEAGKWLFGNRPFKVVRNGRDVALYRYDNEKRINLRMKMGISEDTLVIGHVGNFNVQKNQEFLVRVFYEIRKTGKKAKLYFMGEGELKSKIVALVKSVGLVEDVIFMGSISNVQDMLQIMDIMVFPSLHEGLPLAVVEWQLAALPCLVSDNVTKECSFTNLVKFKSLTEGYTSWAEEVLRMDKKNNRDEIADLVVNAAIENGYDIKRNAQWFQSYLESKFYEECYEN